MPRVAAASPIARSSDSAISAPVGLPGELTMMPRVRGVTAARIALRPHREAVLDVGLHEHRSRVRQLDLLDERRPVRRVRNHFVARSKQRQRCVVERLFAARRHHDLRLGVVDAIVGLVTVADRALEIGDARGRRVAREVGVDGGVRSALDRVRCREVRFAGAEVDHLDARSPQRDQPSRSPSWSAILKSEWYAPPAWP